ncbi:helicase associated domain-containing protein [Streptomyces sp. NBC_01353]|uniref:helicase associated domain-containing protein n=1 Tax=Streptomyces sp. NBC_01353 TaxID=2903835 RepID=UPI002E30BE16|nr:helicase associated domain-containing protein [Streptomyces sp. NBC_01353]
MKRWHFDFTLHPERIARAMDLIAFNPRGPLTRTRREGLASAQNFHDAYGHLDVPAGHTDPVGFELGRFITSMRDARTTGRVEPEWIAELDALGMIWDKHQAAWRARLTAADYHRAHGHLAAPATTPIGAWLAEQRSHATKDQLAPERTADLTAIDPHWQLPYGPDWHRKYHLVRRHLETGRPLTDTTTAGGINLGSGAPGSSPASPPSRPASASSFRPSASPPTPPPWPRPPERGAPSPRTSRSSNSSSTAKAAPPASARRSPSTAPPSTSAPGSPRLMVCV